jgi:hypothetical protein
MCAARFCRLGDTLQSSHARYVIFRFSFGINGYMGGDVASYLTRWKPARGTPPAAADFARAVVAAAGPGGQDRAKCLLWAACKLASWAIRLGMEPVPGVLLHPSVTGRFAAHAPGMSAPARRTLRTNLRFIARAVVPHLDPADAPLPRERAKQPYTRAEIDGYLALADAQPTPGRRWRASALVCLGAGAGLIRSACAMPAAPTSPAAAAAWSSRCTAGHRGRCRCWPATSPGCCRPPRSPGRTSSPAGTSPSAATSPTR